MDRRKDNRWILQKNISSTEKMLEYVYTIDTKSNRLNYFNLISEMNRYANSNITSESTLGVRMSETAFYMLGYKSSDKFVPSILTQKFLKDEIEIDRYGLLNLFSMQYPHPFSRTPQNFHIYVGRLILKLLTEVRIGKKLYIDEFVWFLPFMEKIDELDYEKLVNDILDFRLLSFQEKKSLFESVPDYDDVFSNTVHEVNYYFIRIFAGFGVLNLNPDREHNQGNKLKFKHGQTETYRSDAYKSGARISGYISLDDSLEEDVDKLLNKFSVFDTPSTQASSISKNYWLKDLYEFNMIEYLSELTTIDSHDVKVNTMIHLSKFGSNDGKDFEFAVKEVMDLFDERVHTEIISGSGDTDILCVFSIDSRDKKFNVDSKKSKRTLSQINPVRINNHLRKNNSEYAIIVTSRFSTGANHDISGYNIVNLEAETLGKYVLKNYNKNGIVEFKNIDKVIVDNLGKNVSKRIEFLADSIF